MTPAQIAEAQKVAGEWETEEGEVISPLVARPARAVHLRLGYYLVRDPLTYAYLHLGNDTPSTRNILEQGGFPFTI